MKDIWQYLCASERPIVLYGTGNGADKIYDELLRRGVEVSAIFASDGFVRQRSFRGFGIIPYSECRERYPDMTVLMCFGSARPEVLENVRKIASECEFFAPDVPVYGDDLFDSVFYENHKDELDEVRRHLSDELSVRCFDAHIAYKLSGDISYLESCESPRESIEDEFFKLCGGCFIDLGAYNGDTVLAFTKRNKVGKIIALEPDKRNFRKLRENTSFLSEVYYVNAAVAAEDGELCFDRSKGRGAHTGESGERIVCRSVDSLKEEYSLAGDKLYIKADVEGSELEMINGAQRTIKKYKPGMCIACYHRSEDMFTLPLRVLQLRPDYKIYMRHSPHIPAWDTEFYFV